MTDTDRMLAWLRDAMNAAQRDAEVVAEEVGGADWEYRAGEYITATGPAGFRVITGSDGYLEPARGRFMAAQDPAAVLRRIAADRQLVDDLLAETHEVVEDCWYTCAAATEEHDGGETCRDLPDGWPCDCGRDARVERRVCLLAEAWGWTEAATKADTDTAMSGDTVEIRMTDEEAEGFERVTSALVHFVRPLFEDEVRRRQRLLNDFFNRRPNAERQRSPGCYKASWGWVHVKPGCHCPR